jgi:flagellar biosynthesis protein FlhB
VARSGGEPTEQPTARRLAEARRRGQVAHSRELSSAIALLAVVAVVSWGAPAAVARLLSLFRFTLGASLKAPAVSPTVARAADVAFALALAPLLVALAVTVLAAALQTGGLWSWSAMTPEASRLSPLAGLRRVFSPRTLVEAGRGLLKLAVVAALVISGLATPLRQLPALVGAPPVRIMGALGFWTRALGARVAVALLALALLDAVLVARRHRRALMMTRDEVKRELKETEGDPRHKAERQRLHRQLAEQRMLDDVRKAAFVVVNPEHIAVAVRYDREADEAPVVVAKGERLLAEQIKQAARDAGVPIYRDVSLARTLNGVAEGEEIPEALYQAVAEVLRALQEVEAPGASTPATDPHAERGVAQGTWRRV